MQPHQVFHTFIRYTDGIYMYRIRMMLAIYIFFYFTPIFFFLFTVFIFILCIEFINTLRQYLHLFHFALTASFLVVVVVFSFTFNFIFLSTSLRSSSLFFSKQATVEASVLFSAYNYYIVRLMRFHIFLFILLLCIFLLRCNILYLGVINTGGSDI